MSSMFLLMMFLQLPGLGCVTYFLYSLGGVLVCPSLHGSCSMESAVRVLLLSDCLRRSFWVSRHLLLYSVSAVCFVIVFYLLLVLSAHVNPALLAYFKSDCVGMA